jgi:ribonuclease BN (tRNA processing enzyme)
MDWTGNGIAVRILHSRAALGTSVLIETDDGDLLIDCGDGTIRDLADIGYDYLNLVGIVITHGHFDHIGGIHGLLGYLQMIGRRDPLPVAVPRGCEPAIAVISAFESLYEKTMPFEVRVHQLDSGRRMPIGEFEILAHGVTHHGSTQTEAIGPVLAACGYRISYRDQVIAVTGDTGYSDFLFDLVRGADLALIEATLGDEDVSEEVLAKVHLNRAAAEKIGAVAKHFILYHTAARRRRR